MERFAFILASMVCAWLWHRPTEVQPILLNVIIGGVAFWLGLGPGLNKYKYHRNFAIRAASYVAIVVGIYVLMSKVIPAIDQFLAVAL